MTKEKQAVSQQEDSTLSVQSVIIGKQTAAFLVPDYNDGQKLAVIDEGVLKYLKSLLPKANSYEIISDFIMTMEGIRNHPCTLEAAVDEARDFVAFHTSINLMKRYFDPKVNVTVEKPFNVEKTPPTAEELYREWVELGDKVKQAVGQDGEGYETILQFEQLMKTSHTSTAPTETEVLKVVEVIQPKQGPGSILPA